MKCLVAARLDYYNVVDSCMIDSHGLVKGMSTVKMIQPFEQREVKVEPLS